MREVKMRKYHEEQKRKLEDFQRIKADKLRSEAKQQQQEADREKKHIKDRINRNEELVSWLVLNLSSK